MSEITTGQSPKRPENCSWPRQPPPSSCLSHNGASRGMCCRREGAECITVESPLQFSFGSLGGKLHANSERLHTLGLTIACHRSRVPQEQLMPRGGTGRAHGFYQS